MADYSEMTNEELLAHFKATQPNFTPLPRNRPGPEWSDVERAEHIAVYFELLSRGWTLPPSGWIPPD